MSVFTITKRRFDWSGFVRTVTRFSSSRGADEAFPIVENGRLVFVPDHEVVTLADGIEVEDIPVDPAGRLEAGFDLVAQFAMFHDYGELVCADGRMIEVPDLDEDEFKDEDEDEERPPLTEAQRRLVEMTECDECRSYGVQITFNGSDLVLQTVLVSESDGDCAVEAVADAGLVEEPMAGFINSFVRKSARKRS